MRAPIGSAVRADGYRWFPDIVGAHLRALRRGGTVTALAVASVLAIGCASHGSLAASAERTGTAQSSSVGKGGDAQLAASTAEGFTGVHSSSATLFRVSRATAAQVNGGQPEAGGAQDDAMEVYLFEGDFRVSAFPLPPYQPPPTGNQFVVVVDPSKGVATDYGLSHDRDFSFLGRGEHLEIAAE